MKKKFCTLAFWIFVVSIGIGGEAPILIDVKGTFYFFINETDEVGSRSDCITLSFVYVKQFVAD